MMIDQNLIDLLIKGLTDLKSQETPEKKKGKKKKATTLNEMIPDVDPTDINSVMNALLMTVNETLEDIKKNKEEQDLKIKMLQDSVRIQGDHLDEVQQRTMKGNIIIASPASQGKLCLIKSAEELAQQSISTTNHFLDLIKEKYGVTVPAQDVQAAHHLPNGSLLVRIWNRKPGSAWSNLVNEIKRGGKENINIYANFQLTKCRNNLLYHLRTLKKAGKIAKLYSNENGQLSFKVKETSKKVIVTYSSISKNKDQSTMTKEEIDEIIS